jgi:hypothetical protein
MEIPKKGDFATEWNEIDNGLLDPNFYRGTGYHAAFTKLRDEDPVRQRGRAGLCTGRPQRSRRMPATMGRSVSSATSSVQSDGTGRRPRPWSMNAT